MILNIYTVIKLLRNNLSFIFPTLKAKLMLSLLKCNYGKNLKVYGTFHFRTKKGKDLYLGDNVTIVSRFLTNTAGVTNPSLFECLDQGIIKIGNNTGISSTIISARKCITIGNNVKIGANVRIFDHDFHSLDYLQRRNGNSDYHNVITREIIIEDDVFIGTNTIILKGVHIGTRSIIGAGSVVSLKNIPPDSVVAGNPAQIIGSGKK